jgi:ubiquinone/menaquinone biosynthesis C-methylase UbiE
VDEVTRKKWDRMAANFDVMNSKGPEWRWGPLKRDLFANMKGRILFLAVGTGLDINFFPKGQRITGIDISPKMIEIAKPRADAYEGEMEVHVMDVHEMPFEDNSFDQVYTSCTFCSVPNPVKGLEALRRVLVPGGDLRMFEHTGSRYFPFNVMMNLMTQLTKHLGPDMNRPTQDNVRKAGFEDVVAHNIYLDVVKIIEARAPASA